MRTGKIVLAAVGALLLGVGAYTTAHIGLGEPSASPPQTTNPARFMQIVAHEDDDLLFMNPDIDAAIRAGYDSMTVYLTAGNGRSGADYARSRQDGSLLAYQKMAGADTSECRQDVRSCWSSHTLTVGGGAPVQVFTLKKRPGVQLVFLDLPDGYDDGKSCALNHLWRDPDVTVHTLQDPGNQLVGEVAYTRETLIRTLVALMKNVDPTVVRTQDPAPNPRLGERDVWQCRNGDSFHDHYDHVNAARFADEAARRYSATANPRLLQEYYRDYNVKDSAPDLSPRVTAVKNGIFCEYAREDIHVGRSDGKGCLLMDPYPRYVERTYPRWPRGSSWVGRDADGRLHAFAVEGGRLYTWWQNSRGAFDGPRDLGNPGVPLAAPVAVGNNDDGRLEVFVIGADDAANIYTTYQSKSDGDWVSHWDDMGNPSARQGWPATRSVSAPVVAVNGDGRLQVFVTNAGGGISTKYQLVDNGAWTDVWVDLPGAGVQGAPAAVTTDDGRIEIFASTGSRVLHWYQRKPNGDFAAGAFPAVTPASSPAIAKYPDGRLAVFVREAGTGSLVYGYQSGPGGRWAPAVRRLPADDGYAAPALVTVNGRVVVFSRNGGTGVSMIRQDAANGGYDAATWTDLYGVSMSCIAAAVDRSGRVVAFYLGIDGRMYAAAQTAPGVDSAFARWSAVGAA
ncbi:MAG TPA: PIG-L family deacetylase [Micromonosporaceae bacterium]